MRHLLVILSVGLTAVLSVAQTSVPSIISSNQTWTKSGNPYIISQNTLIVDTATVIVGPGVEIEVVGRPKLIVEGTVQMNGSVSSPVLVQKLEIELKKIAQDFNATTSTGCYFENCIFTGNGSGSRSIGNFGNGIRVRNCVFKETYYGIYSTSATDTAILDISKTVFLGDGFGRGYPIYTSGPNYHMKVDSCLIRDSYSIMAYGKVDFTHNVMIDVDFAQFYVHHKSTITCNRFHRIDRGLTLSFYDSYGQSHLTFSDNTIDSSGGTSNPLLLVQMTALNNVQNRLVAHNNNFLHHNSNGEKVKLYCRNDVLTTSDTLDFQDNFWGAVGTGIDGLIYDYNDNIEVGGTVNYSNYKSSRLAHCLQLDDNLSSLGVSEIILLSEGYPNPTTGIVHFKSSLPISELIVTDRMGRLLMQQTTKHINSTQLDLSDLPNGIYHVRVKFTDGRTAFKTVLKTQNGL